MSPPTIQQTFRPRGGPDRVGVMLRGDTDRDEVRQLVTESYRLLAPKKLTQLIDRVR
jgi:hypothetical protein